MIKKNIGIGQNYKKNIGIGQNYKKKYWYQAKLFKKILISDEIIFKNIGIGQND